uniref:Uncharacterized protein n=1 Tax=Arundo donax TaxID=35708 RepID=A0A0A9BN79_ARUDO
MIQQIKQDSFRLAKEHNKQCPTLTISKQGCVLHFKVHPIAETLKQFCPICFADK